MKVKSTESGNFKITMSGYEMEVFRTLCGLVRLGNGERSDVIFEFLNKTEEDCYTANFEEIGFSYTEDQGLTIEL